MKKLIIFIVLIIFIISILFFTYNKPADNNRTVIKFSAWGSKNETDILKNVITDFEKENPNIKVEFIHIPQNYFQKIHLLFAAGIESDVIFFNNQNIQLYINAGLLEDLSEYFKDEIPSFHLQALNCFKKNGGLYAIPRDISNLVIYYNKDIFKRQNVKMPEKIKDIFELRDIARKVSSKDNFGINFEENPMYWLYYLSSNGGGVISDDKKKIIINQPKSLKALNLYSDMINKDKTIPSKADIGSMTQAQMFINSKLAMYLSGRWMCPKFREIVKFDWDIVEFPAPNKVYIDASGYAISKNSKNKKQAVKFIKYLSKTKILNDFALTGLIIPAKKNTFIQMENQKPFNYKAFTTMLNMTKPTPVNENYSTILDILMEKTEGIFNGTKKAENVFDEKTIKKLEKLLEE